MKLSVADVILPGGILGVGSSVGAHASLSALGVSLDAVLRLWHRSLRACTRLAGWLRRPTRREARVGADDGGPDSS